MDALTRARRPLRKGIRKLAEELQLWCAAEEKNKPEIRANVCQLSRDYEALKKLDNKIADQMVIDHVSEEDEDREYDDVRTFEHQIVMIRQLAEDTIAEPIHILNRTSTGGGGSESSGARGYRLPKIEIKKFSGELKDWLGFWAQYQKVDGDKALTDSDKFQLLIQYLIPGTEAYDIASSYPQTEANYPMALAAIKKRYGNEDLLLQVYIRELLELVISNAKSSEKIPFEKLYLKLSSHLRALKSLKLENADPASWLFPLVESSLPEELLLTWERSTLSSQHDEDKSRLDFLMQFLEKEAEIKQKIKLARGGFEEVKNKETFLKKIKPQLQIPTLANCHSGDGVPTSCLFCGKGHPSTECSNARNLSLEVKRNKLKEVKACFTCFEFSHLFNTCKANINCILCGGRHHAVMCFNLENKSSNKNKNFEKKSSSLKETTSTAQELPVEIVSDMANHTCTRKVLLQTVQARVRNGSRSKVVRVFFDTGSQGSYILKSTAQELGLESVGEERVTHSFFGGNKTEVVTHSKYKLQLEEVNKKYSCIINVRDQLKICNEVPRLSSSSDIYKELINKKVPISDVGDDCPEIEVLIGADNYGQLLTGKVVKFSSGVSGIETKLGWSLCGKVDGAENESLSMCLLSMHFHDVTISNLWDMDLLGIRDELEVKSVAQQEEEAQHEFIEKISRKEDGRYIVALPRKKEHPPLLSNYDVSLKRLHSTTKKLLKNNLLESYNQLFEDWKMEGFIEEVTSVGESKSPHYVPHHPVIKLSSSTTPVRPVFDASCKVGRNPSLNDCLHKGGNFIQLIFDVLLLFREKNIGFISDIRKAFQMIEVVEEDRDSMRFLWWKDLERKEIIKLRHCRVMFGAIFSPFALATVLLFHLKNAPQKYKSTAEKLLTFLYVDNCVGSSNTVEEYQSFRKESTSYLAEAKMDLRLWMSNVDELENKSTHTVRVLGMLWNRSEDTLFADVKLITIPEVVTKRTVLSAAQKIFDPLGIICPAILPVKIILQTAFINQMSWDDELPAAESKLFREWAGQIEELKTLQVPRNFTEGSADRKKWSVHVFTDASQSAYAAVAYLRAEHEGFVSVQLIAAKSRIAPLKKITIPRLELLGCLIGSRLAVTVKKVLQLEDVLFHFWSDSTTAIAWIKRSEMWGTFVGNRVDEIRKNSHPDQWNHVPGDKNPADLPSRGCTPSQLVKCRWWEGPAWLKLKEENWLFSPEEVEEKLVLIERKKIVKVAESTSMSLLDNVRNQLTFIQSVRVFGWCNRFVHNCTKKEGRKSSTSLSSEELKEAEKCVIRTIQADIQLDMKQLKRLKVYSRDDEILCVKTKITQRVDLGDFRYPAVLPSNHFLVRQLILDVHKKYCHAGVAFLMVKLREKYWILKSRKTIQSVLNKCFKCRRFCAKAVVVESPPLPLERIEDCNVFEVVGVDCAGPMFLKNKKKVYVLIFTCAVFRAVHLELIQSLSTIAFLKALKRFILVHSRPRMIISDNGTNFHGAHNFFKSLDWKMLEKDEGVHRIQWKFNVASGSWWGGFWESLIRVMKDLMKRTIGSATLNEREFQDLLLSVEETMNGRPLTYVGEESDDLDPLTPSMFLRGPAGSRFPEGDLSESDVLRKRYKYMLLIKKELKERFTKEYLAQLVIRAKEKPTRSLQVGELVYVGADNVKRISWKLGRIISLIEGKDGVSRVAVVKVDGKLVTRPVQRLYPLEVDLETSSQLETSIKKTRCGREVKIPHRYL